MFLVKHFGTIDAWANLHARSAAGYEAGIWGKRKTVVKF